MQNKLHVIHNKANSPDESYEKYKMYRNKLNHILGSAERKHYQNLLIKHKANVKKSWQIIKVIINTLPNSTNFFVNVVSLWLYLWIYLIRHDHDDVIKWKHFPRYWPFVWGIHRSPVNSPHKGQWRGALIFSLIWAWINGWVNTRDAGDLRGHRTHYDAIVMIAISKKREIFTAIFKTPLKST